MKNIFICGFMAAGKTTVSEILSKKINFSFFDTDRYIEHIKKMSILHIFKYYGEKHFRKIETDVLKIIKHKKNTIVATGGGMFCFNKNLKIAKKCGKIIFLDSTFKTCINRIKTGDRPLFIKHSYNELQAIYEKRRKKYIKIADFVAKNNSSVENCCREILNYIK